MTRFAPESGGMDTKLRQGLARYDTQWYDTFNNITTIHDSSHHPIGGGDTHNHITQQQYLEIAGGEQLGSPLLSRRGKGPSTMTRSEYAVSELRREMNKKTISSGTIARTIVLVLALLNQVLVMAGIQTIPIADETINELVASVATVITSLIAWWKNNSFTQAAMRGDHTMKGQ